MDDIIPYCGPAPDPAALAFAWNLDPAALAPAVAPLAAAWLVAGADRRMAALAALSLLAAFVSPLCALTTALFSARALHHLVLVSLAAPALALAFARPRPASAGALLGAGFLALSALLWAWHLPAVYTAAWQSPGVYWALQLATLAAATAFWAGVLAARAGEPALAAAAAVLGLAGQMGLVGGVLTFSGRILYAEHLAATGAWGLAPLADQQLAGLVMWVPGMVPLALVAGLVLRRQWRMAAAQ